MRLRKIYSQGKILNAELYDALQYLDREVVFRGCNNEFKDNRDWLVICDIKGQIVAYCGVLASEKVAIFVRAWVRKKYRGKGYQRKMIKARIAAVKKSCNVVITYTMPDNVVSSNNLIRCGFKMYTPEYAYAGREMLYWKKYI